MSDDNNSQDGSRKRKRMSNGRFVQVVSPEEPSQHPVIPDSEPTASSAPLAIAAAPQSIPSFPLIRLLSGDMVQVHVGSESTLKTYSVFKNLLVDKSPFFAAAFNPSSFRESVKNEISLPEIYPLIFEIALHWMYTSQLPTFSDFLASKTQHPIQRVLMYLYILGDNLILPDLQNICLTELKKVHKERPVPSNETLGILCESLPPISPLYKLFVEVCSWDLLVQEENYRKEEWLKNLEVSETFAADVAKAMARRAMARGPLDREAHPYNLDPFELIDLSLAPTPDSLAKRKAEVLLSSMRDKIRAQPVINALKAPKPWKLSLPSPEAMRKAGFYRHPRANHPDCVRCLHCNVFFYSWKEEEDPMLCHSQRSPKCPFVRAIERGLEPPLLPVF